MQEIVSFITQHADSIASIMGGIAGFVLLLAIRRVIRNRGIRKRERAAAEEDLALAAEIAKTAEGGDIALDMQMGAEQPTDPAAITIPRMGENEEAGAGDMSSIGGSFGASDTILPPDAVMPDTVPPISELDTPRASVLAASENVDAQATKDEPDEATVLAEIERKMRALKELYENGLIAAEIYVLKAREYAAEATKKKRFL